MTARYSEQFGLDLEILYTGIFFDFSEEEKENLLQVAGGFDMPNKFMHHITLQFRPEMGEHVKWMLEHEGLEVKVKVIGVADSKKVAALSILIPHPTRVWCKNGIPHLTVATAKSIRPFESNQVPYKRVRKTFELTGRLGIFFATTKGMEIAPE